MVNAFPIQVSLTSSNRYVLSWGVVDRLIISQTVAHRQYIFIQLILTYKYHQLPRQSRYLKPITEVLPVVYRETLSLDCTAIYAWWFIINGKTSTYSALLEKCNYTTLHRRCIKAIASEVFKSLNNLNPNFMNKMFQVKDLTYDLWHSNTLYQPKFNKITYGKNIHYGT